MAYSGSCNRNRDSDCNNHEQHQEQSDDLLAKSTASLCVSCGPETDFRDEIDRIEQDLTCAYLAAGFDINAPSRCEEIAQQVHDECSAYFGREEARTKGVEVGRSIRQFRSRSKLEIKVRRDKVAAVKRNSRCRTCGRKGHWTGDISCMRRDFRVRT